jgi:phosphatidylinositol alpha-1,6-mannosyltransferase
MRILLIANNFPPIVGGIATHSYEIAKNLAILGEHVTVLTAVPQIEASWLNSQTFKLININWLSKLPKHINILAPLIRIVVFFLYELYLLRSEKIHLMYCTHCELGISKRLTSLLFGVPYFLAIHGSEVTNPRGVKRSALMFALKGAAGLIALGSRQKVSLLKLGVPDEKIFSVPEGVDLDKFNMKHKDQEIIDKLDLEGNKVILTVGRSVKRKGVDKVIESLPRVLEKVPNVIYLVIGEGPERCHLEKLAEEHNVRRKVIFTGFVPDADLPKYYSVCDVFVMPSREINGDIEGFGIVFLEANACSKPVIGGKSGGMNDAIEDGISGILVDPMSEDEISKTVIVLLTDEEIAMRLGKQGRDRVEREFSYLTIAEKIALIFKDCLMRIGDIHAARGQLNEI